MVACVAAPSEVEEVSIALNVILKLNPVEMEVLCLSCGGLGSGTMLPTFDGVPLVPMWGLKSLGVTLDVLLSLETQVTAFYHLRLIRHLAPNLPPTI